MPIAARRLSVLIEHGLRETEAKAYLALLEHTCLGAAALGEAANVPRTHLYKVLQDLHSYGLVEIVLHDDVRLYRARPFAVYLERRADELRERLARTQADALTLGESLKPPPMGDAEAAAGEVRLMVGRRAVSHEIDLLLASAKSEVLLACSDGTEARMARHLATAWGAWGERGVTPRVTLILPLGMNVEGELAPALAGREVDVRLFGMRVPMLSFVCDQARLIVVHPMADTGETGKGRDFAAYSDDPAFVHGHAALLIASSQVAGGGRPTPGPASP